MSKYNLKNLSLRNTIYIDTNKINEEKMDDYDYNLDDDIMLSDETIKNLLKNFDESEGKYDYDSKYDDSKLNKEECDSKEKINNIRNEIYKYMLPFKRDIQSLITELLYKFEYTYTDNNNITKKYNMDFFIENINENIFKKIYDIRDNIKDHSNDIKNKWNDLRFYLKGGKSLNRLIKKIEKEEKFDSISRDLKIFYENNQIKNTFDQTLKDQSNTDYDFTLIYNENYNQIFNSQGDDNIDRFFRENYIDIVKILKDEGLRLEQNIIFTKFKQEFTKHLNSEFKREIIPKLKETIKNIESFIKDNVSNKNSLNNIINDYLEIKKYQIENFINEINNNRIKLTDPKIEVSCGFFPIVIIGSFINGVQNKSKFLLYRMKLTFKINNQDLYKLNKDIKTYVINYCNGKSKYNESLKNNIPFNNIFGELIDIGLCLGDQNRNESIWNSSDLKYILRPIKYIDKFSSLSKDIINNIIIYNYPIASLKYQLKDILAIFNFDKPQKLDKRCKRIIEYLKMLCLSNNKPDEISIYLSDELKYELKNNKSSCVEIEAILNLLNGPGVVLESNNYYIVKQKNIDENFYTELCKNKFNIDNSNNINDVDTLLKRYNLNLNSDSELELKETIKKINNIKNFEDFILKDKFNKIDVMKNRDEIIRKLNIINELSRIIPIKFL